MGKSGDGYIGVKPGTIQVFANIIGRLRVVAHELGYAVTVHGSLRRDIDLVAIPWTKVAAGREAILTGILEACEGVRGCDGWRIRSHGRLAHIIHLPSNVYIDLSVLPIDSEREAIP